MAVSLAQSTALCVMASWPPGMDAPESSCSATGHCSISPFSYKLFCVTFLIADMFLEFSVMNGDSVAGQGGCPPHQLPRWWGSCCWCRRRVMDRRAWSEPRTFRCMCKSLMISRHAALHTHWSISNSRVSLRLNDEFPASVCLRLFIIFGLLCRHTSTRTPPWLITTMSSDILVCAIARLTNFSVEFS